jgi:hypothetical protein
MPLPRPNYPIELTALIFTEKGVVDRKTWLIQGAQRMDPTWSEKHCEHFARHIGQNISLSVFAFAADRSEFFSDEMATFLI